MRFDDIIKTKGIDDETRFLALQERTSGKAREIVDNHLFNPDKSVALTEALEDLKFFYERKAGSSQALLAKVLEGKEAGMDCLEDVEGLLQELVKMVS